MMKSMVAKIASSLFVGGIAISSNQPILMIAGTAIATASSTSVFMAMEQKKQINTIIRDFEANLNNSNSENHTIIKEIEKEIQGLTQATEKTAKEVKTLKTNNRLQLSAVQKVQHRQRVADATLTRQQQQLDKLRIEEKQPQPVKTNNKVISLTSPNTRKNMTHICFDGNNFSKTVEQLGLDTDWKALKIALVELFPDTDIFTLKYYTGSHANPSYGQKQWLNHLQQLNYEVVSFPLSQRENGKWKTVGDDMAIGLDLLDAVKSGDRVILVSGDGDFIPLIEKLQARDVEVKVVGASYNTNHRLQALLKDNFITLESLSQKIVKFQKLKIA